VSAEEAKAVAARAEEAKVEKAQQDAFNA